MTIRVAATIDVVEAVGGVPSLARWDDCVVVLRYVQRRRAASCENCVSNMHSMSKRIIDICAHALVEREV